MNRTVTAELLDADAGAPEEIAASLADLRRINRWFGGASTMCRLLEEAARRTGAKQLTMLDVGAASGDIARCAQKRLQAIGVELRVTLLDRSANHMQQAAQQKEFLRLSGDALALPCADKSFDLVACSTFLHHLDAQEVAAFMKEALRVARTAVLINDLHRHPLHLALVYAGFPLFRSRLTRHDGPASVRRSYTPEELLALLRQTAGPRVEISRHYLFRMGAIAWA